MSPPGKRTAPAVGAGAVTHAVPKSPQDRDQCTGGSSTGEAALRVPELDPAADVLTAALKYAAAGWHVGPLAPGSKSPGSLLLLDWQHRTSRDRQTIIGWFAGRPLGLGVFIHVGRSGAVALDIDTPGNMPPQLRALLGDQTVPFQRSRLDEPERGHLLVLMPPGRRIGNGRGGLGKGWGEVRGDNGVIVVAPSPHIDGGRYEWLRTGPVPGMPDAIADLLPDATEAVGAATDADVEAFLEKHGEGDALHMLKPILERFASSVDEGGSRHDAAVTATCWGMREAAAGYYPASEAVTSLREAFVASLVSTNRGGARVVPPSQSAAEFAGIVAWAVAQADAVDPAETRAKVDARLTSAGMGTAERSTTPPILPPAFWESRPELLHVRDAAWAEMTSPDAALAALLLLVGLAAGHQFRLPRTIGGDGSLSLFVANVGAPGQGKSRGVKVVTETLAARIIGAPERRPIGSGEGVLEAFYGTVEEPKPDGKGTTKVRRQVRHAAWLHADEVDTYYSLGQRSGTTLGGHLRSAWTAETLGTTNASADTNRLIPGPSYALGLTLGVQTSYAGPLLAEANVGTPQRLWWTSVVDPTGDDTTENPGPLDWQAPIPPPSSRIDVCGRVTHPLGIDPAIRIVIRAHHRAVQRGEVVLDEHESHAMLLRLKVASLLALLARRTSVDAEDWDLAGRVVETSNGVRRWVQACLGDAASRKAEAVNRAAAHKAVAIERTLETSALESAAASAAKAVRRHQSDTRHGEGGCTRKCVHEALGPKRRAEVGVGDAIDEAVAQGWLTAVDDSHWIGGASMPAT